MSKCTNCGKEAGKYLLCEECYEDVKESDGRQHNSSRCGHDQCNCDEPKINWEIDKIEIKKCNATSTRN